MSEPTKLDYTLARKKTEAEAARYPLLARLGLAQTWTGQGQADQRATSRAAAEVYDARRQARERDQLAAWRVELRQLLGPVVLRYIDWHHARSAFLRDCNTWPMWTAYITRARRGEPPIKSWTPQAAKRRAFIPPSAVRAILQEHTGFVSGCVILRALEAQGVHAHILDVSNAVLTLRDLAEIEIGPRGGYRLRQAVAGLAERVEHQVKVMARAREVETVGVEETVKARAGRDEAEDQRLADKAVWGAEG